MSKSALPTLFCLRTAFEADEDWVAVGHVEYLLDRMTSGWMGGGPQIISFEVTGTLH